VNCEVTYEELAAFAAAELDESRRGEIPEHLADCGRCRQRVAALRRADSALAALRPFAPDAATILSVRRALSEVTRGGREPEIMTLEEVGAFLRVTPGQLGQVVEELPAFELAGQVRVRRARLIEWIAAGERDYIRQAAAGWAADAGSNRFRTEAV
jgi:anti-sigma factor RsiW